MSVLSIFGIHSGCDMKSVWRRSPFRASQEEGSRALAGASATSYSYVMNRRGFLKWTGLGALAALAGGFVAKGAMAANEYYSGPVSDHFDGRIFFNPAAEEPGGKLALMRSKLGTGNKAGTERVEST